MPKPTILQTLLREPTRSYSNSSDRDRAGTSYTSSPPSSLYASPSFRRGTSIRSATSIASYASSANASQLALDESLPRTHSVKAGTKWEWASFGARRGINGSVHTPSLYGDANDAGSIKGSRRAMSDDGASIRSSRSFASVRSAAASLTGGGASSRRSKSEGTSGAPISSKPKKDSSSNYGTSRRYSDMPRPSGYAESSRAPSSLAPTSIAPSSTYASSITSSRAGSDDGSITRKKKKKKHLVGGVSVAEQTTTTPSPLQDPEAALASSLPAAVPSSRSVESRVYPKRSFALERVDEGLEEELEMRRRSVGSIVLLAAVEAFPKAGQLAAPKNSVPNGVEQLSTDTLHHLNAFVGSPITLGNAGTEKLPDLTASLPEIGRSYTADELFGSLPTAPALSSEPLKATETTSLSLPPSPSVPSLATSEGTITSPPPSESIIEHDPRAQSPNHAEIIASPVPAALQRVSTDMQTSSAPSSDVSSAPSSSIFSATALSSPATEISSRDAALAHLEKHDTVAVALPTSTAVSVVPKISLTRTISDQAASGSMGDVEVQDLADPSASPLRPKKSPERRTTTKRSPSPELGPVVQIIASSQLTSANLASTKAQTPAATDTPTWIKKVRELGDSPSSGSLLLSNVPKRSSSTSKASSMERAALAAVKSSSSLQRASSLSGMSSPGESRSPSSLSQTSPGQHRQPQQDTRSSSPTSSPAESIAGSSRSDNSTPRRRTKSAHDGVPETSRSYTPTALPASPALSLSWQQRPSSPSPLGAGSPPPPMPIPLNGPEAFGMTPFYPPQADSRRRAASVLSGTTDRSDTGMSTVSSPAYRSVKSTRPLSIGPTALHPLKSTMNALSISAHATVSKGGFSLFRKSSTVSSTKRRAFNPRTDLTFGPLQPVPAKIRSTDVLVEVLAVGIDLWDRERTCEQAEFGFGFIPGRSFCGRVLEVGMEVTNVKRGEMVYGLNDLKKSGALAELLSIDRNLVAVAPACGLMPEQIASLPHAGVPAVLIMEDLGQMLPKGSKILILDAATGTGNMLMQLAPYFRRSRDLWVMAQCEESVPDGAAYCRATGASDVLVMDAMSAMNSLHESSFDVVIDTVGGRDIYDAARRILHSDNGQFITTIGDELVLAKAAVQYRSGIRSLRRSFFKKEKKNVSYLNITLDKREYVRETLDKLRAAVQEIEVKPSLRRVLNFQDSGLAFEEEIRASTAIRIVV